MSPENNTTPTKICPTCGTKVSLDAERCLVCGTDLSGMDPEKPKRASKVVQGSRMPEITLSLPAVIGLLTVFLIIGAVLVYLALNQTASAAVEPTATPTLTLTPSITPSPTAVEPTATHTPLPSPTPLSYTVQLGDTCGSIAYSFDVAIQSIVLMNNLPADCSTLYENQKLLIPNPTPTATPPATSTLSPQEATEAACQKLDYTVQENDTLGSISLNYAVPADAIREYNGLVNDVVRFGQVLVIPLCRRNATPGPSPTPTLPPPYSAVNLLMPPDGAPFNLSDDVISLQWASVGTLRENEAYAVTIEDLTEGQGRKLVDYVSDTKFIVPSEFLPNDGTPHVIRWSVVPVRQTGTDDDGNSIWEPAGAVSEARVLTWLNTVAVITPTP
jgi:LysM repeat protein/ribosomal protein L40E